MIAGWIWVGFCKKVKETSFKNLFRKKNQPKAWKNPSFPSHLVTVHLSSFQSCYFLFDNKICIFKKKKKKTNKVFFSNFINDRLLMMAYMAKKKRKVKLHFVQKQKKKKKKLKREKKRKIQIVVQKPYFKTYMRLAPKFLSLHEKWLVP